MINITKNFKFEGTLINTFRYGQGHINETHVVVYKLDNFKYRRYLLQKINSNVFKDVEGLMKNIKRVTEFAHQSIINEGGNPFTESLTLIPTIDNKDYYVTSNNEYWRAYIFVEEGLG